MAAHEELISELPKLDKLSNAARLKAAKRRRIKQLKKYQEWVRQERASNGASFMKKRGPQRVALENGAVLNDMVSRNDIIGAKKLLDQGVDPNISNADGLTPLHKCCIDNTVELAELLIEFGADLNARDVEGWTPLHAASATGNLSMINILLDEGASLVAINHDDKMPVDVAADGDIRYVLQQRMLEAGYTDDVLEYIRVSVPKTMLADLKDSVRQGRSLNVQDKYGTSALHIAAANGYMEVLSFLLEQDSIKLNIQDNEGWTPFHAAVCWEQQEVMKKLAEKGANMDIRNLHGETAYAIAEEPEIRQYILDLKAQYGKAENINLEEDKSDGTMPRTRRMSVKRMRQTDKENMMKDSIKEEASMRRASMIRQDHERGMTEKHDKAMMKEMSIAPEEESITLLGVHKLNSDDMPPLSPLSVLSSEGESQPSSPDRPLETNRAVGGGEEVVGASGDEVKEKGAGVKGGEEEEEEEEEVEVKRKAGSQKAIENSIKKLESLEIDDELAPHKSSRNPRKSVLRSKQPTPVHAGPIYTSTSAAGEPLDSEGRQRRRSGGLRECCSIM